MRFSQKVMFIPLCDWYMQMANLCSALRHNGKDDRIMKKNWKLYLTLFTSTFTLSAFTFGGGYVIAPLMKKKFVDKLKWIGEEEMLNLVAISQSSPGVISINASILVGYRMAGVWF